MLMRHDWVVVGTGLGAPDHRMYSSPPPQLGLELGSGLVVVGGKEGCDVIRGDYSRMPFIIIIMAVMLLPSIRYPAGY